LKRKDGTVEDMTATHEPSKDRVCIGAITGVRGIRGEVRIKSFTADPSDVAAYGPVSDEAGERSYTINVTAHVKGQIIARLDGIDDRDAAEALKGTKLYVPKNVLPEPGDGAFYQDDLIGLRVETEEGSRLGTVKSMHNFGAGDIIEIAPENDGGKYGGNDGLMLPFTTEVVPVVDVERGLIVVAPPNFLEAGGKNGGGNEDPAGQD
jgi:16S rRNA processing protein RimM